MFTSRTTAPWYAFRPATDAPVTDAAFAGAVDKAARDPDPPRRRARVEVDRGWRALPRREEAALRSRGAGRSVTRILILDDDTDLLAALGELLGMLGHAGTVGAKSFDDLVRLRGDAFGCELAILDINLGPSQPSGLDVYHWLRREGFPGRIAFLTGHASSHPLVAEARRLGEAAVLQKPVSVDEIMNLVPR
jgi:CheY-like chemotaxis protein